MAHLLPTHPLLLFLAHVCHAVSERNDCWLRGALERDLAIPKQTDESHHYRNCPEFFGAFLQCDTAHDVLMPIFFHRNARC